MRSLAQTWKSGERFSALEDMLRLLGCRACIFDAVARKIAMTSRRACGDHSTRAGAATRAPDRFGRERATYHIGGQPSGLPRFLLGLVEAFAQPFKVVKVARDRVPHQGFGGRARLTRYTVKAACQGL